MTEPIRYIALDFDNCICEVNEAFRICWDFLDKLIFNPELNEHWHNLQKLWVIELDKALCDQKLKFLNDDVMMLLKHVHHGPLDTKPTVFVYTNNTNEELVRFVRCVIEKQLRCEPWSRAFFPQDSRRRHEFQSALASDEPGKSFEGMKACMGNPEDMTPETLMFLDDLMHPIKKTIGENYVHIQPPFKSKDKFLPYLETLVKAIRALDPTLSIEHSVDFRIELRNYLHAKSSHLEYFPAPRDAYREWNLFDWKDFLALFQPFGGYVADEDDDVETRGLNHYYKCRDLLTQRQDVSASESSL